MCKGQWRFNQTSEKIQPNLKKWVRKTSQCSGAEAKSKGGTMNYAPVKIQEKNKFTVISSDHGKQRFWKRKKIHDWSTSVAMKISNKGVKTGFNQSEMINGAKQA